MQFEAENRELRVKIQDNITLFEKIIKAVLYKKGIKNKRYNIFKPLEDKND